MELVRRFFGSGELPDYSMIGQVLARDPYAATRRALSERWSVLDLTDHNSDLAFVSVLDDHPEGLTVRLSMVGPYAFVGGAAGEVSSAPDVWGVLEAAGFSGLSLDVLTTPVTEWAPRETGVLYEFLFEYDNGLPWDRYR